MGVHGLWRLLDCFGQVTTPEDWRDRRVAVDASIWMAQFRSMCAPGEDAEQKILEGFLVRILKLIFYGIKPLFVFDGVASVSKTVEHRRRQKAREALAAAAVKRHAREILAGQLSAGVLDVHQLPRQTQAPPMAAMTEAAGAPSGTKMDPPPIAEVRQNEDRKRQSGADEEENTAEIVSGKSRKRSRHGRHSAAHRHHHHHRMPHHRRHRRRIMAPEAVSRAVTDAFLDDAEAILQERSSGEQRVLQNALRFTSTSLFMGPRKVVDTGSSGGTHGGDEEQGEENTILSSSDSSTAFTVVSTTASMSVDGSRSSVATQDDDVRSEVEILSNCSNESSSEVEALYTRRGARHMSSHAEREGSVVILSPVPKPSSSLQVHVPVWRLRGLSTPTPDNVDEARGQLGATGRTDSANRERPSSSDSDESSSDDDDDGRTSSLPSESVSNSRTSSTSRRFGEEEDLWNPSTQLPTHVLSFDRKDGDEKSDDDASEFTPVQLPRQTAERTTEDAHKPVKQASATWRDQRGGGGGAAHRVVPFELLDIVTLLECCGIPFCLSPSEADAQCAYLCTTGVVDAVFTEDSDVVVHGGTTVLRGFFSSSKQVVQYRQAELAACGLDKRVLVALALLLGCDYTEGVSGVGLVGSLQALTAAWSHRIPIVGATKEVKTGVVDETNENTQPEFVCALLERWRELVCHPSISWETGDKDVSLLQDWLLRQYHHEWASLGLADYVPSLSAATLFYTPEVARNVDPYEFSEPKWPALRSFAASRGLLGTTWVVQRFELAQRAHAKQVALAQQQDVQQRRLTDFGVQNRVRENWAYKKLPHKFSRILENLRGVRQKT